MKKRKLGTTDLFVTPVAFGVLTMGGSQMDLPLQEGAELIRYAIDKGINFFDTAQYYETYPYLREALKGMDRAPENPDFPVICTKCLGSSYEEMEDAIEEALEEMDLETIDIFLLHEVRQDPDWDMRAGAWQCLQDYKAKGVIRAIGVSTHHVDVTAKMAQIPECDVVFPLINFASLGIRNGDGPGTCEEMEGHPLVVAKSRWFLPCIPVEGNRWKMVLFRCGRLHGYRMDQCWRRRLLPGS